jgi:hypothetical protein
MISPFADLFVKPGLGHAPVSPDRARRHFQDLGYIFDRKTSKEPHLDNPCFLGVDLSQAVQRIVELSQVNIPLPRGKADSFVKGKPGLATPAFRGATSPGIVNQNAANQLRGNSEEVGPVFKVRILPVHQPEIRLVHQGCGLKGVIGTLLTQVPAGQATQLVVNEGGQFVHGALIAISDTGVISAASRNFLPSEFSGDAA